MAYDNAMLAFGRNCKLLNYFLQQLQYFTFPSAMHRVGGGLISPHLVSTWV